MWIFRVNFISVCHYTSFPTVKTNTQTTIWLLPSYIVVPWPCSLSSPAMYYIVCTYQYVEAYHGVTKTKGAGREYKSEIRQFYSLAFRDARFQICIQSCSRGFSRICPLSVIISRLVQQAICKNQLCPCTTYSAMQFQFVIRLELTLEQLPLYQAHLTRLQNY